VTWDWVIYFIKPWIIRDMVLSFSIKKMAVSFDKNPRLFDITIRVSSSDAKPSATCRNC